MVTLIDINEIVIVVQMRCGRFMSGVSTSTSRQRPVRTIRHRLRNTVAMRAPAHFAHPSAHIPVSVP